MKRDDLTQERLKEVLHYDLETGVFTWKVKPNRRIKVGDVAKNKSPDGYFLVGIGQAIYLQHRLAWLYVHGVWPPNFIDHLNGDRSDNRICNLREATNAQNLQNRKGANKRSKTGFLGVSNHQSKFWARITKDKKMIRIGSFLTPEEAHEAYLKEKRKLHEHCTI